MGIYGEHILPHLIHLVCGSKSFGRQRKKVVPQARGRVLEVGMGSGHNLPFYDPQKVTRLFALEPSRGMRKKARRALSEAPVPVEVLDLPGEEIPLPDHSVDTVILTYTLCTIPDWRQALTQMRRVLAPGGTLLFAEHGRSPDPRVARLQTRLQPIWGPISGGCHLGRDIPKLLNEGGFCLQTLETGYELKGPRFASYQYLGSARPR
ncbi:MAG TPA: class I SAM-dependent methyltransferase [Planctomycetes bacterium]|nr:class I SAM-dependent methyltransferase [Planctomycetota bacterium]